MYDLHKKILIVEDEEPLSSVLNDRLTSEGFKVIIATNGEDGMAVTLSEKPNLILLDILLPKKGGLAMLKDLHANPKTSNIPVIMLTNLSDANSTSEAQKYGAHDYLVKADTEISDVVDAIRKKLGL